MGVSKSLAVVVPAYNEGDGLREFHQRLATVFDRLDLDCRVIYVDDGSADHTWRVMQALAADDGRVATLRLSRNFGKELAMTAGLDYADADAVVVIDADLQDPPELIPELLARWREGFDVVYGTRDVRAGESWLKRLTATAFYRLIGRISPTPIPADTGDFRLLDRRAHQALKQLRERHRFMKGLFAWVGYRQTALVYHRDPRHSGTSKFNYWKLWNFAIEGITSFSTVPLRLATYLGLLTALVAFVFGIWVVVKAMFFGDPVPGYPSLMAVILFLGGLQLLALGVIGEYLGRLFTESKQRPLYLLQTVEPARADAPAESRCGAESEGDTETGRQMRAGSSGQSSV
ncbi:MAG: glycosyltransferase family 2 protein [Xanthomonadales bacterium]|nr:glycosyltransferase family 2 protein [Xanthomonadales bacterium]